MGRSIPVNLGRFTFPSKSAAEKTLRVLRDKHMGGAPIQDQDDIELLRAVVAAHPESAEKIGAGIDYFYVAISPEHPTFCFYLQRCDGTRIDFSWKEALTPTTR